MDGSNAVTDDAEDDTLQRYIQGKTQAKTKRRAAFQTATKHWQAKESSEDVPPSFFLHDPPLQERVNVEAQLAGDDLPALNSRRGQQQLRKHLQDLRQRKHERALNDADNDSAFDTASADTITTVEDDETADPYDTQVDMHRQHVKALARKERLKAKLNKAISKVPNHSGSADIAQNVRDLWESEGLWNKDLHAVEIDVLYECQRGLIVFGVPRFSSKALLNFDPHPWVNANMKNVPYTNENAVLPSPEWRWLHVRWLIDMTGDVDEKGWSYAFSFTTSGWRATAKTWRSFVRRRRWIRARTKEYAAAEGNSLQRPQARNPAHDTEIAIFNSDFADRDTAYNFVEAAKISRNFNGSLGRKKAYELLPILPVNKTEVIGWEGAIDARNPFLSWDWLKEEGQRVFESCDTEGCGSAESLHTVWKQSLIEVNLHRVQRVLAQMKADRERLELWKLWLGLRQDGAEQPVLPDLADVWDLVDLQIEQIVKSFEYQTTLQKFFAMLLSEHSKTHGKHRFQGYDTGSTLPLQLSQASDRDHHRMHQAIAGLQKRLLFDYEDTGTSG